jgi:hypothetical protein
MEVQTEALPEIGLRRHEETADRRECANRAITAQEKQRPTARSGVASLIILTISLALCVFRCECGAMKTRVIGRHHV